MVRYLLCGSTYGSNTLISMKMMTMMIMLINDDDDDTADDNDDAC